MATSESMSLYESRLNYTDTEIRRDDIYVLFGNAPGPLSIAQQSLVQQVQARWYNFAATHSPNAPGWSTWSPITFQSLNLLSLGSNSTRPAPPHVACTSLWGRTVAFDEQMGY